MGRLSACFRFYYWIKIHNRFLLFRCSLCLAVRGWLKVWVWVVLGLLLVLVLFGFAGAEGRVDDEGLLEDDVSLFFDDEDEELLEMEALLLFDEEDEEEFYNEGS